MRDRAEDRGRSREARYNEQPEVLAPVHTAAVRCGCQTPGAHELGCADQIFGVLWPGQMSRRPALPQTLGPAVVQDAGLWLTIQRMP